MTNLDVIILEKTRDFNRIEKEFIRFTYDTKKPETETEFSDFFGKSIRMATDAYNLKNEIVFEFQNITTINIYDNAVKKTLDKIRKNKRFESIHFYESVAGLINADKDSLWDKVGVTIDDYLRFEKFDEIFEEFNSWFDYPSYYHSKMKIGPIITSSHVPKGVKSYFIEIQESFAFGLYKSSVALCRALLEMTFYDKLKKKGKLPKKTDNVLNFEDHKRDNLAYYIGTAKRCKIINHKDYETAKKIKNLANDVLHIKDSTTNLSEKDTFEIIFNTIRIVERLY